MTIGDIEGQNTADAARIDLVGAALRLSASWLYVETNPRDPHGDDHVDLHVDMLNDAVDEYVRASGAAGPTFSEAMDLRIKRLGI